MDIRGRKKNCDTQTYPEVPVPSGLSPPTSLNPINAPGVNRLVHADRQYQIP